MKITPLEIRQKDFEKKLRGYDKDEVNAFLQSLSNEWERVIEESKELKIKLQHAEKEVAKLREVETSLYKTLKTAEDTGANVVEQANKAAELHMRETQINAEAILNEAKNKARAMIEKAEVEARQIIEELQDAVRNIEENHRELENNRQRVLQELKSLSVTLMEKVEQNSKHIREFRLDDYTRRVRQLAKESDERIKLERSEVAPISKIPRETNESFRAKQPEPELYGTRHHREDEPRPTSKNSETHGVIKPVRKQEVTPYRPPQPEQNVPEPKKVENVEQTRIEIRKVDEPKGENTIPKTVKTVSFFDELDADN